MVSKVFLAVLITLGVAQLALASPVLCPNPEAARTLHYKQEVHESAPYFGRVEKVLTAPRPENTLSCVVLTGLSQEATATSITAIGISEDGVSVKLVSGIQSGIDVLLELYTE